MNGKKVAVVSGVGVDDACCAAAVLLRNRGAEVLPTTPRCIDVTLEELADREGPPGEIHVCGASVMCDWGRLAGAAEKLREKESAVFWHAGSRGIEEDRERFEAISIPAFVDCGTNTEAVCVTLRLAEEARMLDLLKIAESGVSEEEEQGGADEGTLFWIDFARAAGWEFLRSLNRDRYGEAIRRLLSLKRDEEGAAAVTSYRQCAAKYVTVGSSEGIGVLRAVCARCAEICDVALVEGESGIEREEAARLIHRSGPRALRPFVMVTSGRMGGDPQLAGSTLFGRVKGAHGTGGMGSAGAFTAAEGGTLFLDEVGVIPLEVQGRLLRALECGEVVPEGAGGARPVRARVIAGSSLDLAGMVREGYFLEDLYHRIGALRIVVPPLRQRMEDITVITRRVMADLGGEARTGSPGRKDLETFAEWEWPGGVPQLVKVVRRAGYVGMSLADALKEERGMYGEGERIEGEGEFLPGSSEEVRPLKEVQREYAMRAWKLNNGNTAATARALGISRNTLASYIADAG